MRIRIGKVARFRPPTPTQNIKKNKKKSTHERPLIKLIDIIQRTAKMPWETKLTTPPPTCRVLFFICIFNFIKVKVDRSVTLIFVAQIIEMAHFFGRGRGGGGVLNFRKKNKKYRISNDSKDSPCPPSLNMAHFLFYVNNLISKLESNKHPVDPQLETGNRSQFCADINKGHLIRSKSAAGIRHKSSNVSTN